MCFKFMQNNETVSEPTVELSPAGRKYLDEEVARLKSGNFGVVRSVNLDEMPTKTEKESIDLAIGSIRVLMGSKLNSVVVTIFSSSHRPKVLHYYGDCASNIIDRQIFYKTIRATGYSIRPPKIKEGTNRGTVYAYRISRKGLQ